MKENEIIPKFLSTPKLVIANGYIRVQYEIDIPEELDATEISWYRVDNIDRSMMTRETEKVSNEKDCRKIAVSRFNIPNLKMMLTRADVGKHIKVNIKPKCINCTQGMGLNLTSRIITIEDIFDDSFASDFTKMVINNRYEYEQEYWTAKGKFEFIQDELTLVSKEGNLLFYDSKYSSPMFTELIIKNNPEKLYLYINFDFETGNGYAAKLEQNYNSQMEFSLVKFVDNVEEELSNIRLIEKTSIYKICIKTTTELVFAYIIGEDEEIKYDTGVENTNPEIVSSGTGFYCKNSIKDEKTRFLKIKTQNMLTTNDVSDMI